MKRGYRLVILLMLLAVFSSVLPQMALKAEAATALPNEVFVKQETEYTCTLAAITMMLRARMYLSGNAAWDQITESVLRPKAWAEGIGARWTFTYALGGNTMTTNYRFVTGISASALKALLDEHPEGVVIYSRSRRHAVFVTDYEGDTFYCADSVGGSYSFKRIPLGESYLAYKCGGGQDAVLKYIAVCSYISSYSICSATDARAPGHAYEKGACRYCGYTPDGVTITQQPSSVGVANGEVATVKVAAQGDGLTYRWYFKNAGAKDYTYTPTFKGDTYSVTMTDARAGRQVLCRVYDKYGNMVQSQSAVLSQAVTIQEQPRSVVAAKGEVAAVKVIAQGDGLIYRWYFKDAGAKDYTYTPTFKGDTYSVKMTDARAGRRVLCRVYDKYGNVVRSEAAVLSQAVTIQEQPQSVAVAKGEVATVKVIAQGDGLTYRWYFKNANGKDYTYTPTFKGDTYSVTMTDARAGRGVICRVYDKYGNVAQAQTVKLNMKS